MSIRSLVASYTQIKDTPQGFGVAGRAGLGIVVAVVTALLLTLAFGAGQPLLGHVPAAAGDSLVRQILAQVSEDSIRTTIQRLQDFNTRYSYAPGCSLAAEYILRRFLEAGIEAEYHRYEIPACAGDLCVLPGGEVWLVDTLGTMLRSRDRGTTWKEQLGLAYCHLFGLCFSDSAQGWAVGRSVFGGDAVILHSSDRGMNWAVQVGFERARLNRIAFLYQSHGWAAGSRNDSGFVVRTTDCGQTWSGRTTGTRGELRDVCFVDCAKGWAVGWEPDAKQALVQHTTDGGATWITQLRFAGRLGAVSFTAACAGWVVGGDTAGRPLAFHTSDAGLSWTDRSPTSGFTLRDAGFLDAGRGWCAGDSGFVFYTADTGRSWSWRRLGHRGLVALAVSDSLTLWLAGERDTVLVTTNRGASWSGCSPRSSYVWSNVLGRIDGTVSPDTIWMASAHYDSYSTDPCRLAPGADDDASGTAALVELARVLGPHRFRSSILLAAFSGEEQNFIGSGEYVRHILPTRPNIAGLLNLDMIGYRDRDWAIDVIADSSSESLADSVLALAAQYVPMLSVQKVVDPRMRYWDTNAFWDAGYRAVTLMEREFNPGYHTPGDTLGLLTMPFATDVTKSAAAVLATFARCVPGGVVEEGFTPYALRHTLEIRPNPFRNSVVLRTVCGMERSASLRIYDAEGRLVRSLLPSGMEGETDGVVWDCRDGRGRAVAEGVYFCRLVAAEQCLTKKLVLQR